ncbi:MAG TPA: glycosyltransferase family 2 protein [Thermoanaerobaculia bacterium]|nr:glycosyltransferase family 2 protein [Thermoanaerobaculia bacterium]
MIVAAVVFWVCLAVCVYIYFGYPALLWVVSRFRSKPVAEADVTPFVTFIVPAYNEERNIAAKIENTLGLDYPADKIEVLVMSNGSVDRTNEIVRGFTDPRVQLVALPQPGKMEALNEGARLSRGEVLVFTDADFLLDHHTLREIARKFADPQVGGVCGARNTSVVREGDATGEGEGMYARWDKWQKVRESRIGSVFAADGLLYAIRRSLYTPITDPAQSDDMAISMRVVTQGYRLLYEPRATAYEKAVVKASEEFRRKIRITNHSVSALLKLGAPLVTSGFYSVELLSHKLIRHFIAYFLIPLFVANVFLATASVFYMVTLAGQLAIYGLALIGAFVRNRPIGRSRFFTVPYYFCFVNAAAFFGILTMLRRHKTTAWSSRPMSA